MADLPARWQLLSQKLAGSAPEHRLTHARIGGGPALQADPRLLALLPPEPRAAAVLVGLMESPEGAGILLTVRAAHLRMHAGQIAFPGGAIDAGDADPVATALREAHEEVGLDPAGVNVLGYLPDQFVLTGFRITPVVAWVPAGFQARLQADEVQESFVLPLDHLLDPANERTGVRQLGDFEFSTRDLQFGPHRIWGATAGVLFTLRELVLA